MLSASLRRRLLAGLATTVLTLPLGANAALAAPQAQTQTVDFNIQPGSLDGALQAFAHQSGRQLIYTPDLVAGLKTSGVRGRLTSDEAIARLLAGAPIEVRRGGTNAFVLKRRTTPIRFEGEQTAIPDAAAPEPGPTEVAEVVVTGSLIRGAGDGASPIVHLDRETLDSGGHATLADALSDLPQNFGGGSTPANQLLGADRSFTNDSVATGINLRGLGSSATLILLNGRRVAGTGLKGNFADVSAIPTGAVERVEVLLDGASALYGSDAVGGVVNVRLRRNFIGAETRLRASVAEGGKAQERQVSQTVGFGWTGGNLVVSGEYHHRDALAALDRRLTKSSDLRGLGGTDHRNSFAHPGNIVAYSAAVGGYVPLYAIPRPAPGTSLKPTDFIAGSANLGDPRQGSDTLPEQERASFYASVRQDVGQIELSADAIYTHRRFSYLQGGPTTILTVRQANPYFVSPTGAASHLIGYNFTDDLGPRRLSGLGENLGLTFGAARDFGRTWRWDAYGAFSIDRGRRDQNRALNTRFLNEALGNLADDPLTPFSAARDGYFNPFGTSNAAVLDFVNSGYQHLKRRNRVSAGGVQIDGVLLTLPAGPLKMALGVQARHEDFIVRTTNLTSGTSPTTSGGRLFDRDVSAGYVEFRAPLVSPEMGVPGVRRLELSLAGRIERYSDFGVTRNPKIGAVWTPIESLKVRASYGTSFRAPTLADIYETYAVGAAILPDTSGQTLILMETGGNPDLGPETARTWTLGFDLASQARRGARLSLTYFDTRFSDQVGHPVYDDVINALTNPIYASFVRRLNPTNAADMAAAQALIDHPTSTDAKLFPANAFGAILDGRNRNVGELKVRGLDLQASWPFSLAGDNLVLNGDASYLFDYKRQLTVDAPTIQYVDLATFPVDLRANLGLAWTHGDFVTNATLRYVDDYRTSAGVRIDSWTTLDAQVRWTAPSTRGPAAGVVIALSAQNLLGQQPPFYDAVQGVGYDSANADVLGRVVALQLTKRW